MDLKDIYLSIYSFGYSAGFLKQKDDSAPVLSLSGLLELAETSGLGGIEIPMDRYFPGLSREDVLAFHGKLKKLGLGLTCDLENFTLESAIRLCELLPEMGLDRFRIKMSGIYGGARYLEPGFQPMLGQFEKDLLALSPALKKHGVQVLIENHQDLAAEELLHLIKTVGKDCVGVNWDVGSSLALTETPLSFLEKVGPYVGNVHLKDYLLYTNERGFKLVRCALGKGAVDLETCLNRLFSIRGKVPMSIELGALQARQTDIFRPEYWHAFPKTSVAEKAHLFAFVSQHGIKEEGENWKTCWERGKSPSEIKQTEFRELEETLAYLRKIQVKEETHVS